MAVTVTPEAEGPPAISVIVVNYNRSGLLSACLAGLRAQQGVSFDTIVVDNASTDDSLAMMRQAYPEAQIVSLTENRGFAGGNNVGASRARGRRLAFLNNDAVPEPQWLERLANALETHSWAAMATSRIVYQDDPGILDSAGDGMTRWGGAFKRFHGQPITLATETCEVFGACGAAFLIDRDVFEEVGGFDEDFFLSHEDVDLSYRVQLTGRGCVYAADAVVTHAGSATLGRVSAQAVFHGQRNLEWTYVKNTPWPLIVRTLPGHVLYGIASAGYHAVIGQGGPFVRAKLAAIRGLRRMIVKRRGIQRARRSSTRRLWNLMDRSWLGIKWREKRFDVRARP